MIPSLGIGFLLVSSLAETAEQTVCVSASKPSQKYIYVFYAAVCISPHEEGFFVLFWFFFNFPC